MTIAERGKEIWEEEVLGFKKRDKGWLPNDDDDVFKFGIIIVFIIAFCLMVCNI